MTWHELPRYKIDELNYSVIMPSGEIALELIPMRYGIAVSEQTKSQLSPSVEVDGVKVELGELYGVTFLSLILSQLFKHMDCEKASSVGLCVIKLSNLDRKNSCARLVCQSIRSNSI